MRKIIAFSIVIMGVALSSIANAQLPGGVGIQQLLSPQQPVTLSVSPTYPEPGGIVEATVVSYSFNIDNAFITWTFNGAVIKAGVGIKKVSLKIGGVGSTNSIKAIVETGGGVVTEKEVVIQPATVDLVWESESYTPPFYKGKALYAPQGEVVITALPNIVEFGSRVSSANLIFKWKKNGQVLGSLSGVGKNKLTLTGSLVESSMSISVEVTSSKSVVKASQKIIIRPATPKVVLYEDSPLYGIRFNNAIVNEFTMKEKELTLIATPYFFNAADKDAFALSHTWRLNNKKIEEGGNKNIITFRRPEEAGVSQVSLGVESQNKVLQSARSTITLKFEKEENENN